VKAWPAAPLHFWAVERTAYAIAIAAVIAIPLGILLGANERAYRAAEFVIDFFRSTPASAMFPLFLVLFGVGNETKISVAAFGAMLVILFNVAYGVMNARKTRLLAAKVMGASRLQVLTGIMLLADLRRAAQRRVTRAGDRRGGRDVHRLDRRTGPSRVRGAAAVQHARHVCGDLCRRRARLWA
jgi:ABC-type dipeptide/oligopeptide/nickel transport system permease component